MPLAETVHDLRSCRSDTNGAVVGFQQQHQLADVKGRVATLVGGSGNPGVMRIKREASSSSVTSRTRSTGMTSSESCSGSEGDSRLASAAAVSASTSASGGGIGVGAGVGAMKSSRSGGVMGGSGVAATSNSSRVYYAVDPKDVMVNKNAFMCPFLARYRAIVRASFQRIVAPLNGYHRRKRVHITLHEARSRYVPDNLHSFITT